MARLGLGRSSFLRQHDGKDEGTLEFHGKDKTSDYLLNQLRSNISSTRAYSDGHMDS